MPTFHTDKQPPIRAKYTLPCTVPFLGEVSVPVPMLAADLVVVGGLLTDVRFSGGTTGLRIGHIAPEAVDAGPIAFVRDGDKIRVDVPGGTLDLLVSEEELASRKEGWEALPNPYKRGVLSRYVKLV